MPKFSTEPVILTGVILAALNLGAAVAAGFGVTISPEQIGIANAVLGPLVWSWVRSKVTPVAPAPKP